MVYTKLERSFNTEELHQMLSSTLNDPTGRKEGSHGFRHIERPPMPPGSSVFEQAKGELEIERQSERNGMCSLPTPSKSERCPSGRNRLNVPLSSPVPPNRAGNRSRQNSARRSPSPFGFAPIPQQSGRLSPYLQIPSSSRPSSARSNHSGSRSRSVSPR